LIFDKLLAALNGCFQTLTGLEERNPFGRNRDRYIGFGISSDPRRSFSCLKNAQLRQLDFIPMIIIGGCVLIALINIILWTILIKHKRAAKKAAKSESADNKTADEKQKEKPEAPVENK